MNLDNHVKRVAALLETALYFQSKTWEWWWITDELFNLTLNLIESLSCVECRTLATVHHLYGKFLFVNSKNKHCFNYSNKICKIYFFEKCVTCVL